MSQQPPTTTGASNLAALSLQEDAMTNTFSSLDTNEAAIYRLRLLSNWSMPRLLAYLYSENGQTEIQEAFQLNETLDLARQCIAVVGFGQLLLAGWRAATAVDCGESGVNDYVHDPSGRNPSSSLGDIRKPKENFMEFCSVQMRVLGSIALSCVYDSDATRLPLLEACSDVLCDLLMAYARPIEDDPVEALLAGVEPTDLNNRATSAFATSQPRTHRSVSLLPLVRGALEGLLFVHTSSTSIGGGVGISAASSSNSHVHPSQGQGPTNLSPLHLWFAHWRRWSSSCPLSRLISNLLITLLHEQRRQPGSLATTLQVPHAGPSTFDVRPSGMVLPPPTSSFTSSLTLGSMELTLEEEETADARAGDAWLNLPHTLSIAAAAAEWLEVALVPMMQRVGARARQPCNNNIHIIAGGGEDDCFAQAAYGAMEDALDLCCCIMPASSTSSSSSSEQSSWIIPPVTVIQVSSHVVTNALRLFRASVRAGNSSGSISRTGQPPQGDPIDFLRSVRCRLVAMAIVASRNATVASVATASSSLSSSLSRPSPSQICELFECCCRIAIEDADKDKDHRNNDNSSDRGGDVERAALLITEVCSSMLLPMPVAMANGGDDDDDDDGDEEEKVEDTDCAHLCLLRAVLQTPWMAKAMQHHNNNNSNTRASNSTNTRPRLGTDAFSFRAVFVTAMCQGLGVALADALARLLVRSSDPSHPLTQRRLTGLRRCVAAAMVLLGMVEMEHHKAVETGGRESGHGGGGGRGVNERTTASAAALGGAGNDDGNDALRLHPPVLRKLGQGHSSASNHQAVVSWSSSSLAVSLSSMRRTVEAIADLLSNHRGGDNTNASTAAAATTAAASLAVACRDLMHLIDRTMTVLMTADGPLEGDEGGVLHHHHPPRHDYPAGPAMAAIDRVLQRHRRHYPHQPHPRRDDRDSSGSSDSHSLSLLADGDGDGLFWRQVSGSADPLSALMCAHYLPGYNSNSHNSHINSSHSSTPMVRVLVRVINSAGFKLDACTLRLEVFSSFSFSGTGEKEASSCVIMEDHYQQQQQYHQSAHAHALQRDDNHNGSGGGSGGSGNVVMIEYWQPGVAVEKIYHLQLRRFAAIRVVLRIGYRHPATSSASGSTLEQSPMDFFQTDYTNTNSATINNNNNNIGTNVGINQRNTNSTFTSSSSSSSLTVSECDCAPLHIGVAQQLLPYPTSYTVSQERHEGKRMVGAVPLAEFQALWDRLPCTGMLPVTTTITTTTTLLHCVSDCIDHHVLLCTGQEQGQESAALGLPVVDMSCRVQHLHRPHHLCDDGGDCCGCMDEEKMTSVGPLMGWAMQTLWGNGIAVRIDARARHRATDRSDGRADEGELVMQVRCADEHTLAAILADAPAFVKALSAGVLQCAN